MILNKSVALVVGGVKGYGRNLAQHLLKQGAKVIVADTPVEEGLAFEKDSRKQFGESSSKFLPCDLSNSKDLNETFEEAKACFGSLDIVCNDPDSTATNESSSLDFLLTTVVPSTYKAIDLMSKQNGGNGGVILNVGAVKGLDLISNTATLTNTNLDIVSFSRSFQQLLPYDIHGLRINCICPYQSLPPHYDSPDGVKERLHNLAVRACDHMGIEDGGNEGVVLIECEKDNGVVIVSGPDGKIFEMTFDPVINVLDMYAFNMG